MAGNQSVLTARDIMATSLITFRPMTPIQTAISTLISKQISGAPVVDDHRSIVGILSELDCLRVLSSDVFYADRQEECGYVRDFMTPPKLVVSPDLGLYRIAHHFLTTPVRRIPVVDSGGRLLGQVSRRDVLQGISELSKKRMPGKHYPDYRAPA